MGSMKLHLCEDITKTELDNLFTKVYNDFKKHSDALGFRDDLVQTVPQLFKRKSSKCLGRCVDNRQGSFVIELNPLMLQFDDEGKKVIEDVIAHELLHTLPGCFGHGNEFHKKARQVKQLMGYTIDTLADENASNYFMKYASDSKPNYKLVCNKCGREIPFDRPNNYLKYPKNYQDKCGGDFTAYKLNKTSGNYEEYVHTGNFIG